MIGDYHLVHLGRLAVRRRRNYDVGFMRGTPEQVVRDSLWAGTAYSAPVHLLAAQA